MPYLNTSQSAANQIRVSRHPSRQPIRIEYYVTRELSAMVEGPSRLSAPLLAIAYLNTWGLPPLPPPSALLTLLLLKTPNYMKKSCFGVIGLLVLHRTKIFIVPLPHQFQIQVALSYKIV